MVFANDTLTCVNKECITQSDVMKVTQMRYGAKEYESLDEKVIRIKIQYREALNAES